MPCLTTWAHSCSAVVLPMWTMSSPKGVQKQSHGCSCQGCKATNHTGTLLNLPKHWNSPEPSEPSGSCRRNLHQHTTEPSGTFRNLPPEPTPAHTGTLRNLPPEPTPANTGTLRNSPEPASGTYTSTHRNSPEPSSGTCSCDPHRHTPELIWAEDPISLRCWGTKKKVVPWTCSCFQHPFMSYPRATSWAKRGRANHFHWAFKATGKEHVHVHMFCIVLQD